MIKAFCGRKAYYLFDKKEVTKDEALKLAADFTHEAISVLEITCANLNKETDDEYIYEVERKSGNLWCVTRKERNNGRN